MKKIIYIIGLLIIVSSCNRWVAPPYTDVESLSSIRLGMTLDEVTSKLEIEPYDLLFMSGNDDFIAIFNYRIKDRRMRINNDEDKNTSTAQSAGVGWFNTKDTKICYIYFKDGMVKSLISEEGTKTSAAIVLKHNNIKIINKDELSYYTQGDTAIFYVPLRK